MGTIATAFNTAFADGSNVSKTTARSLGTTIENFLAAPYSLNNNATASPTSAPTGYVMRVIGKDADAYQMVVIDSFGGIPALRLRRANGTGASPTAVVSGDTFGEVEFTGYYTSGGAAYDTESVTLAAKATENWTSTAQGSKFQILTTANTTTSPTVAVEVGQDNSLLATGAIGFLAGLGAGSAVTQLTNKSTGVTLNKICGQITMSNAILNANTTVSFTFTNSFITATDILLLQHIGGGTLGSYNITAAQSAGSSSISVRNVTAGNLSEAIVISFAVIRCPIT